MDLVLRFGNRLWGVEFKRVDAPRVTRSMKIALDDLGLEGVTVIYPGLKRFPMADKIVAMPVTDIWQGTFPPD